MAYPPPTIRGHCAEQMQLICYAALPASERRVVMGRSSVGLGPREECGIAICKHDGGYYIFTCDAGWNVIWDGWTSDIEVAVATIKRRCPDVERKFVK